jgi:membrane-bound lytic murein transglycosylase D
MTRLCFAVVAILITAPVFAAGDDTVFPRPSELEPAIRFWTRVYTEVDTNGGFIHDDRNLDVVYQVIHFPPDLSEGARRQRIEEAKRHYRQVLRALAGSKRDALSEEERRVLALWPKDVDSKTLRTAAYHLRFQLGQADRFRAGLIRSGAWEAYIEKTLSNMGLPAELVALPHVESSYNPLAYSRAGAAGLWQLTRSTGRRYLRVDGTIDERLDPYVATVAAARLLEHNHDVTGTWPLAITAYNHGVAGIRRAIQTLGTHDIETIDREYDSRTFGFSSRNFYPAFLAALDVHFNADRYFGALQRDEPIQSELVEVPAFMTVNTLQRALGIDRAVLQQSNLALQPAVWRGSRFIPRGYRLRVPVGLTQQPAQIALARVAQSERHAAQRSDGSYIVEPGNTLSEIALRFNVSVEALMYANGLDDPRWIRAGQILHLPTHEAGRTEVVASATPKPVKVPADDISRTKDTGSPPPVEPSEAADTAPQPLNASVAKQKDETAVATDLPMTLAEVGPTDNFTGDTNVTNARGASAPEPDPTEADVAKAEQAEPASAGEAAKIGPTLLPSTQPSLSADPSDYSVADDGTIEVQVGETLGHYAEWLEIRASRLRELNRLRYDQPVVVGHRVRLDLRHVDAQTFEKRRLAYHRALQEAFFAHYQIAGTHEHIVRRGESVWILAQRKYNVPLWLLRQYNPDLDLSAVLPGTSIIIPLLEVRSESPSPPPADSTAGATSTPSSVF